MELSDQASDEGSQDWRSALIDHVATSRSNPEPTPVAEVAAEPEPKSEPVAAQPDPTPSESPSLVQSTPAPDVPTTSAVEALSKRGFNVTDEKLAAEYLRIESEFAAMKRAEKEAQKAQPATPQPEAQKAAPEPVIAPKPAVQPQIVAPEPPAAPTELPADLDAVVRQHVDRDSECRNLAEQLQQVETELDRIGRLDEDGNPTGGLLYQKAAEIARLEQALQPASAELKAAGIEVPELDEIQRDRIEARIARLYREYQQGVIYHNSQKKKSDGYVQKFITVQDKYRNQVISEHTAKFEAEQTRAAIDAGAVSFRKTWDSTVETALKLNNVPADLKEEVVEAVRLAGYAKSTREPFPHEEVPGFVDKAIKAELAKIDKIHRLKSKEYAEQKRAITQSATPGPTGANAVAPATLSDTADWREKLSAEYRAYANSKRAAR